MAQDPQLRKAFGLKILKSGHKEMRALKRAGHEPEVHGNKFWNTSYLVMDYLRAHPIPRGSRVMEVGCGWGLLGIYCARQFNARLTGVDVDKHVFPYLELHARINGVEINAEQNSFERLTTERLSRVDLLLGADICFWDHMSIALYNLVRRALRAGVKQIIIADPCRPPFTDLATRCLDHIENCTVEQHAITRPVHASGELLIVKQPARRRG